MPKRDLTAELYRWNDDGSIEVLLERRDEGGVYVCVGSVIEEYVQEVVDACNTCDALKKLCRDALGITHDEYGSLPLVRMLVESRDAAMEALRFYAELERAVADDTGGIGSAVYIQGLSERTRASREKVLKGANDA